MDAWEYVLAGAGVLMALVFGLANMVRAGARDRADEALRAKAEESARRAYVARAEEEAQEAREDREGAQATRDRVEAAAAPGGDRLERMAAEANASRRRG